MSDHEFEKQVRQQLGDLKLTPGAQSWEKIENEIRERKRRRAPFLWLPILLLGLGAGGYFILTPGEKPATLAVSTHVGVNQDVNGSKAAKEKLPDIIAKEDSQPLNPAAALQPAPAGENNQQVIPTHQNKLKKVSASTLHDNNKASYDNNKTSKTIAAKKTEDVPQQTQLEEITAQPEKAENNNTEVPAIDNAETKKPIEEKTQEEQPVIKLTPAAAADAKTETAVPAATQKKKEKNKKWSFGVTGSAGVSTVNEGKFVNFSNPMVEDVSVVPDFAAPAVLPNPTPLPSKIYPDFAYSAGVFVKRALSKRFSLSAGLNYLRFHTRSNVGYKVEQNQIVNNGTRGYLLVTPYYMPDNNYSSEYKNSYQFIELPVSLHTRINRSKKLPLYWNAGIAVSQLLSSNSLHYDGTTGVYYKNDKLLNRTQVAATTGFSVSLFNRSSMPLWIGPSVRYNLSTVLKKDVSASKNFMNLGLDIRLHLK